MNWINIVMDYQESCEYETRFYKSKNISKFQWEDMKHLQF